MPEVLTFKIEDFEGPLDLLLYLVGKNKMNLYDVNIMELIEQYTAAIREMQQDRMEISTRSPSLQSARPRWPIPSWLPEKLMTSSGVMVSTLKRRL